MFARSDKHQSVDCKGMEKEVSDFIGISDFSDYFVKPDVILCMESIFKP